MRNQETLILIFYKLSNKLRLKSLSLTKNLRVKLMKFNKSINKKCKNLNRNTTHKDKDFKRNSNKTCNNLKLLKLNLRLESKNKRMKSDL